MIKFNILCDPNAKSNGSSRIIVDAMNNAAKKLGLHDDHGVQVFYDCLCQTHGQAADVLWSAYELPFPKFLLESAGGKPILGLSRDNAMLPVFGGYPSNLVNYVGLGVDSEKWRYCYKEKKLDGDPFVFLCCCESNTRSGFEDLIPTFGQTFGGNQNVVLYIKDRNATDVFKQWVKDRAADYNVRIIHDDRDLHTIEEQIEIYSLADYFVCVNHSHTFGMNRLQAMSCGVPVMTMLYQGGREYLQSPMAGADLDFEIASVDNHVLNSLVHIGLKNHLFPVDDGVYKKPPFWAKVDLEDLAFHLQFAHEGLVNYKTQSLISRSIAQWHTWERSAANMSVALQSWSWF